MKIEGLVVATHTPFHENGSLAPELVPGQAAHFAAQDLSHVFITGSTGEAHSLTRDERLAMYDAWAAAAPAHKLNVIAHVGSNCLEDAKAYARRAEELGFAAVSALAPSYFKPAGIPGLIDWCAAIASSAPRLPFYFYDIPVLTGVNLPMDRFLEEASGKIPNLAGIKFTNPDLTAYRKALNVRGGAFDLPWGIDETLLGALATGATGGVGSTYNFAAKLNHNLIAAFRRDDLAEARRLQSLSIDIIDRIAATGYLGTAKALMGRIGVPVGPARLPLTNPTPAQVDALMAKLATLGIPGWPA